MQVYGARKVDIRIGVVKPDVRPDAPIGVVILAVAPPNLPWMAELFPASVVRSTRYGSRDAAIEHLRFAPAQELAALPGLDGRYPSLVRDSVRLALAAGASQVDVVFARAGRALPWDLHLPEVQQILIPYLPELQEAQIAMPDATGPAAVRPDIADDPETRIERLVRVIQGYKAGLRESYQVGYLDLPAGAEEHVAEIFDRVGSADFAICRWRGAERPMRAHSWRSAGAALAGLQARPSADLTGGIAGLQVKLGAGRRVRRTRHPVLLAPPRPPAETDLAEYCVELAFPPTADDARGDAPQQAMVRSEPSLRRPTGGWPLPALRTVKAIHHRVVFAAEQFVFRPVEQVQAFSLVTALDIVLRPFIEGGALVGPGGAGGPLLSGDTVRDANAPGLVAEVAAQLRPWCQDVRVRVAVDPGREPRVELFTA